jgi:hypothetical protein
MSVKKYKFVSPGIFIKEVDQSFRTPAAPQVGPLIVGRTRMGPAMRPVKVESFGDFVKTFGNPVSGFAGGDLWREGNLGGPTYAAYAAQAYLASRVGPVTMMRILGVEHANKSTGVAGWTTSAGHNASEASNGGAYGLFIFNSGSQATQTGGDETGAEAGVRAGTLAAVWYLDAGSIQLRGDSAKVAGGTDSTGTCALLRSNDSNPADNEFRAVINDAAGTKLLETSFNFNRSSDLYIRKVFNTNPQLLGTNATTAAASGGDRKTYFLGQTYDQSVAHILTGSTEAGFAGNVGAIVALQRGTSGVGYHDQNMPFQPSKTGWFIAQDMGLATDYTVTSAQKLFKLVGLEGGTSIQSRFKVSIEDVRASTNEEVNPFGTFAVVIRDIQDNDNNVSVVERFANLTLDPNSPDYIARRIGDKYLVWDETNSRYREYGDYDNRSVYMRVEMNASVENGATDPRLLPFGVIGHPRPIRFRLIASDQSDGDALAKPVHGNATAFSGSSAPHAYWKAHNGVPNTLVSGSGHGNDLLKCYIAFTGSVVYPGLAMRSSSLDGGLADQTNAYFGVETTRKSSTQYDESVVDYLLPIDEGFKDVWDHNNSSTEASYLFTLDDLAYDPGKACMNHVSGSRQAGSNKSVTAISSSTLGNYGYTSILDQGYDRFTTVFAGGHDGVNIKEMEPFGNVLMAGKDEFSSYEYNTIKRALRAVADPEFVEMNLLALPGVTTDGLTKLATEVCEERGDSLAIIDITGDYTPRTESTDTVANRRGVVGTAVSNLKDRKFNTSYGACYYPWVQIRDSIDASTLWAPPSVAALGVMASSERASEVWFAPAGFNRGGLSDGAAGIPVIGVRQRLSKKDRDNLYEQGINPIAKFPSEGIVIFGQKTLQARASALDRVNVRRLMIYLKKEVSRRATQVLFDQNVEATWNRFKALVEPLLASCKARFGLTEYRLILDETTTTPDLIDQNVLYAKIMLKPARAIEYIAIDFNIMPTGASFDD